MQPKQYIIALINGKFDAYDHDVLIASECDTREEAQVALAEQTEEEKQFTDENGTNE